MADGPLYYGGGKSGPAYYGKGPVYYSKGPTYYGKPAYYGGGPQYGGSYGAPSYYANNNHGGGGGDDGSIVGTITVGRMLRVIAQRWLSVFVFLLVGTVIAFAVYRVSPTIYEATSEFTMDTRRMSSRGGSQAFADAMPDYGVSYSEIFNTRLSDWRSEKLVNMVVQQYKADHPLSSSVSDDELVRTLGGSRLELMRNSRIITITLRSRNKELAAALANAYAEAIEMFTDEENKLRCDKAVSQIHGNVEKKRREVDKIAKQLLDFRAANKVDNLRSTRDTVQQGLSKATSDILALETEETQLVEWEKLLAEVQKKPETFGNLSAGIPRAEEIAKQYGEFQTAATELATLLTSYTEEHPAVKIKAKLLEGARQRFVEAASHALSSSRSSLVVTRNQMAKLKERQIELRNELASLEQQIVLAESGLGQLEAEFQVANRVLEGLILDENKARMIAEGNNEIVRVGRRASVPNVPVLPNPTMIFGAGIVLSIALGLVFVLVIDNLEDTVVNLSDIEGRLALRVLAVLPHIRRKKREQVAKFVIEERYSHFAEAVAGLRNLLDSPRYESMSRCMLVISTQPGEGKTITSCSIASAYAMAGKRTLLADFDLRRPRQATVWDLQLDQEHSFSHMLQAATEGVKPDFASLVNSTPVEGLDVIASLPPDGVSPATILGSSVVADFFTWARANYDRIIIDSPPYGLVGDVVSLSVLVDSSIIMCCPDRTHFKPIQYCSRCLTEAGANILGVIVNDVELSSSSAFAPSSHHHGGHYGGGYGGYGYGYGYSSKTGEPEAQNEDAHALSEELSDEE